MLTTTGLHGSVGRRRMQSPVNLCCRMQGAGGAWQAAHGRRRMRSPVNLGCPTQGQAAHGRRRMRSPANLGCPIDRAKQREASHAAHREQALRDVP
eukprot:355791-Chlamydomonas_euryale.AAC.3